MSSKFQMADVAENEAKMAHMRPSGGSVAAGGGGGGGGASDESRGPSKGFVVREAPWANPNEKVSFGKPRGCNVLPHLQSFHRGFCLSGSRHEQL